MKQRIRYFCLTLLVMVAGMANAQVAQIEGGDKYATLQAAVAAAEDGATIQVIKAGEYAIPAITKNLTIEATVNGVVVNHTDNAAITTIASGKTATFKNITFNLGTTALATGHGFGTLNGSNGALVMDGCTINGALNLFGASTLNNCTFNAEGIYNIWAVNDDATFTGCTFTNTNRAVNVYDQKNGTTKKNVSFSNCTFKATGTAKKKAAINIHHNPSHNSCAQYNVSIDNCSTTGDNWASTIEETGEPEPATICNSPLWMVSDIENGAAGDIAVTVNNVAQDLSKIGAVAKIGDKYYTSLAAAVAAAEDDQTVEILKAGEYAIPAIPKNLTIEATVNGVVVNHTDNAAITTIASGKTATFKNITFNLGTTALATGHGFGTLSGSNGALVMDGCTINGALNLFGESTFTNCKFNAEGIYNIWAVNDNATFTGCTFTNTNRAVNVYDQKKSSTTKNVSFTDCTFTGSAKKKAAVNIHHNPDGTAAKYAVSITNCTTSGTWASTVEETGEPDGSTICYSPLWMISDIVNWEDGDITVTVDGKPQDVSKFSPVAKIGEKQYYSLAEAFEAAIDDQTITVLTDIDLPSTIAVTKKVTLDLDGKTISNTSDLWAEDKGIWSFFSVQAGGNLTVTGEGTIDAKENDCYTFDARNGGILTIKNGTFKGNISCVYLINEAGTGVSTCNIEGGTFSIKQLDGTSGYNFLLNCRDASYKNNTAKFNVTGGSFVNFNPANNLAEGAETNFCAAGYEAVQDGNVWTVQKAPVAQIGETTYTSLAEAFEAAQTGQTITVLTDIDLPSTINVTKQVTLDLNGKTISNTSDLWVGGNWSFFSVRANGNLTVGNGTIDAKENDCFTFDVRDGGILTIKDGTYTGNISSVYLINEAGTGVSTCNIEGGTFSIKQLSDEPSDKYRFLLNCYDASYANNAAKFNVTGGSFVNFNPANNLAEGTETNFCAAGYEAVQDGDVWTVQKAPVAKIGETTYTSLADAFTAATDNQTITVLTDIDLPSTIAVTKQVTLDLNRKTISNTSDLWVGGNWSFFSVQANGNLTVTGNGTIDAKENDCFTFDVRNGGILTIKDGTYTGNISSVYLINEAGTGVSTCNIEGGTFSIKQLANNVQDDKYRFLLNCYDASYANNAAKFNVTGGSFVNFNPANNLAEGTETNFCAAGYEAVQDGNVWTVQKAAVAQIEGGAKYETLQAAINACEAGTETTIKLLDNVTDGAGFAIPDGVTNKNIIIDFDGKFYNVTKDAVGSGNTKTQAMHFYSGNTLTLKNGTITSAATSEENKLKMMMQNYCDLTLDGMTIDCSNTNGGTYPDYSGTTYEYWSFKSVPVFNFNTGNATIKNTTITFRDGDNMGLCVDGGTVALGEGVVVNGPVSAVTGTVTITDGKYSGAVTADQATVQISGGVFTVKPADEYCAQGYVVTDNTDEATKVQYPFTVKTNEEAGIFVLYDKEPYKYVDEMPASEVTYVRSFGTKNVQSWYVPFDYTITEEDANNFLFYKIHMIAASGNQQGGDVSDNTKVYIYIEPLAVGTLMKANRPYVIQAKDTVQNYNFIAKDIDKLYKPDDTSRLHNETTEFTYDFYGTYKSVFCDDDLHWIAISGGNACPLKANTELKQYRWYIKIAAKQYHDDYAKLNFIFVEGDGETNGISAQTIDGEIEGIYTLGGMKVEHPVKGVNIIKYTDGRTKKIYVK